MVQRYRENSIVADHWYRNILWCVLKFPVCGDIEISSARCRSLILIVKLRPGYSKRFVHLNTEVTWTVVSLYALKSLRILPVQVISDFLNKLKFFRVSDKVTEEFRGSCERQLQWFSCNLPQRDDQWRKLGPQHLRIHHPVHWSYGVVYSQGTWSLGDFINICVSPERKRVGVLFPWSGVLYSLFLLV